jgi:hypothetical protein
MYSGALIQEMQMNTAMKCGPVTIQREDLEKVAGGFTDEWPCGNDILF